VSPPCPLTPLATEFFPCRLAIGFHLFPPHCH
jgi:hypothetical protein